jgi:Phage P22-like portal protein
MPRPDGAMNKISPKFGLPDKKGTMLGYEDGDEDEKEKVLETMRKRMEQAISAEAANRKSGLDDKQFLAGNQWPQEVMGQRNLDKRPCLTINKLPTFIAQVVNGQRENRPSINISPTGDMGDPEVAKMYRGLIRFIERDCHADGAYDTAFDDAVTMGWGYFRIVTDFEAPDTFDQIIIIKRVRNAFTVYMDPMAQDPTGADAKWCFISDMIPREEFRERWPDAVEIPYNDGGIGEKYQSWATKDELRIVEYFEVKTEKRTLVKLSNGHTGWKDELDDITKAYIKRGRLWIEDERESEVPKVMWYKATAVDILEESEWIGTTIPVIRVIGNAIDIEGKLMLSGLIRHAKDPQRMYNYWRTAETELIALQPKAPWVMEEGQGEGHEDEWKNANVRNIPVLYYKGTSIGNTPAPPPQRQPMAGVPAGVVQAATEAAQDMQATTGVRFDASQNERMVDESGKAIRELRRAGDIGAFHYVDNLSQSLRRCGEILVEIIPKIYNERRVVTILREDDKEEQVRVDPDLMKPTGEEKKRDGKIRRLFNPTMGKYGVTVTIGPSYATKRIEASESMMAFMRALPNTAAMVADLFAAEQDWPGADRIAARLAKTVPPELMQPEMKDVPPQVQALLQSQDVQIKKLGEQLRQAMAAVQDKNVDRQIDMDKIQKNYEVALLKIVADTETKMAKIAEAAQANVNTHITAQMEALGKGAAELGKSFEKAEKENSAANDDKGGANGDKGENPEIPPEAHQHLKPGRNTRFANGQTWTMGPDGKPTKVG